MDPNHQREHPTQSKRRHHPDQVHQPDPFVIERQSPTKDPLGVIQKVMLRIAVRPGCLGGHDWTINDTHCFDLFSLV